MNNRSTGLALGLSIAFGLTAAGFLVSSGLSSMKRSDRFVTVKGLVEREVTSDLVVWNLKTKATGNDLIGVQRELDAGVQKIIAFLKTAGVGEKEIAVHGIRVIDRRAQEYGADANAAFARYIVEATVLVRSPNVVQIAEVSQKTGELLKNGVVLVEESGCNSGPDYLFTKLNEIKPQMLAEATKNARASAEQFAADSGSRVGQIRQANQGYFSITARDAVNESNEGSGCGASDPYKKIRVVTTIDYYLEG